MSLYNILFGANGHAGMLLATLGLDESKVPRFRDCYIDGDRIVIYTRTGGGNRDFYGSAEQCRSEYPDMWSDDMAAGPWNSDLVEHPNYCYDQDDDFDSTYASFYFSFPDEYADELTALSAGDETVTPGEKWRALLSTLADPSER